MCEDLYSIDVYGYNVHYIIKENNKKMFLAADIIRQYNDINGTKKELRKCFENIETQEMIKFLGNLKQQSEEKSLHPVMYPTILHFCLFHYIDHTKILVTLMLHFREILLSRDIDKRSFNFAAKI